MDSAEASPDADKHSKRDRFRDALTRTKSKWKKERTSQEDFKLSDDVNDFLAAGRQSTSSRPSADSTPAQNFLHRPSSPGLSQERPPSRGASVPKIDVTQSQRYPNARTVDLAPRSRSDDYLSPHHRDLSPSFSSLAKKRGRARGLSVSFDNKPPIIIGEGGDEAETPPDEISKAKQRSRSLSPYTNRPPSAQSDGSSGYSPVRRKPMPPPTMKQYDQDSLDFVPKPLRRTQTGFQDRNQPAPGVAQALEQQLEHALNLGQNPPGSVAAAYPMQRPHVAPPPPQYVNQMEPLYTTDHPINPQQMHTSPLQYTYEPKPQQTRPIELKPQLSTEAYPPPPQSRLDYLATTEKQRMQHGTPEGWI